MADLHAVITFIDNADAHTAFLDRVTVAVYEEAITLREGMGATLSDLEVARQEWALSVFGNPKAEARRMLPALAIRANTAGLIDDNGFIVATDTQIRATVAALIDEYTTYISPTV